MTNSEPIFQVSNKHSDDCGKPPTIDGNAPERYYSYFENEYGEQCIFVYDYQTQTGTLYMGDIGCVEPVTITEDTRSEVILYETERLWLGACWIAATSRKT